MAEFRIKTIEESFRDWQATAFGFGYGTGEAHVLPALKRFFELIGVDAAYDYHVLEKQLSPTVAWLLINVLCRLNIIEYGSSPRFGWLTPEGEALKDFVDGTTAEQLINICCSETEDDIPCSPDACNCGPAGYVEGRKCPNPFWR